QYHEKQTNYWKKRAVLRSQCREDMRRANKDTLLATEERCYKSDRTLELDFFTARRDYIANLPGITKTVRSNALDRLDLLTDAIKTVTFAIDSGVYASTNDLMEAKTNLLTKYSQPFANAFLTARTDREISWLAYVITSL